MGGIAFRAPVLASIFLIVGLATLAMPGSANFVGEFLILLGVFKAKVVFAFVASVGVAMAAVYVLRAFIRAMHNRVGPSVDSREVTFARPRRARAARARDPRARAVSAVRPEALGAGGEDGRRGCDRAVDDCCRRRRRRSPGPRGDAGSGQAMTALFAVAAAHAKAPHIDYAGLSPFFALGGGALLTLLLGLLPGRWVRAARRRCSRSSRSAPRSGSGSGSSTHTTVARRGRAASPTTSRSCCCSRSPPPASARCCSRGARSAAEESAHGEFFSLLLFSVLGMAILVAATEPRDAVPRLRAAVDPAVRAVRDRAAPRALARVGPQVPDRRLGRLGDAASTGSR